MIDLKLVFKFKFDIEYDTLYLLNVIRDAIFGYLDFQTISAIQVSRYCYPDTKEYFMNL